MFASWSCNNAPLIILSHLENNSTKPWPYLWQQPTSTGRPAFTASSFGPYHFYPLSPAFMLELYLPVVVAPRCWALLVVSASVVGPHHWPFATSSSFFELLPIHVEHENLCCMSFFRFSSFSLFLPMFFFCVILARVPLATF